MEIIKLHLVMDKDMQNPYPPEDKGTRVGVGVQILYPSQTPTLEEGTEHSCIKATLNCKSLVVHKGTN